MRREGKKWKERNEGRMGSIRSVKRLVRNGRKTEKEGR